MNIKMTEDEYRELVDSYGGVCIACGEFRWEGCEPDACNYECEACGENEVFGAEEALIMGNIHIVEKVEAEEEEEDV